VQLKAELDAKAAELAKAAEAAAQPVQCGPAKSEEPGKKPIKKKVKKSAANTAPLNCAPGSTTAAK
jgi:hypothetical protein